MKNTRFQEMVFVIISGNHKRFSELVNSPYFNKNERIKRLWLWIMGKYITPQSSSLLKGEVGSKRNLIFTKEELKDAIRTDPSATETDPGLKPANFRMVLSDFVKLSEVFLLLEGNDLTDTQRDFLIEKLRKKELTKSYRKHVRIVKEETKAETNRDVEYYNALYLLECEELAEGKRIKQKDILERINGLTDFIWMCMKLDGFIKLYASGGDIKGMTFYKEIMDTIENDQVNFKKTHAVIYSRYLAVRMFENGTERNNQYLTELEKYTSKLKSAQLLKNNYEAMIAYCRLKKYFERESALMKKFERIVK